MLSGLICHLTQLSLNTDTSWISTIISRIEKKEKNWLMSCTRGLWENPGGRGASVQLVSPCSPLTLWLRCRSEQSEQSQMAPHEWAWPTAWPGKERKRLLPEGGEELQLWLAWWTTGCHWCSFHQVGWSKSRTGRIGSFLKATPGRLCPPHLALRGRQSFEWLLFPKGKWHVVTMQGDSPGEAWDELSKFSIEFLITLRLCEQPRDPGLVRSHDFSGFCFF